MPDNNKQAPSVERAAETMANANQREYKLKKTINVGGFNKTGTFVATIPSIMQRVQIGVLRAKLLDGANQEAVDKFTDDLTFMIAYLDTVLTKKPKWFDWETMDDVDAIKEIFWEVSNWVNSFRRKPADDTNAADSSAAADAETVERDEDI